MLVSQAIERIYVVEFQRAQCHMIERKHESSSFVIMLLLYHECLLIIK